MGAAPSGVIKGKPYSATQILERVQTLADGTHITQTPQETKLYRDSEGRTRVEHVLTPPPGAVARSISTFIQIMDPVAGYRYILNAGSQEATRYPLHPTVQRLGNNFMPSVPAHVVPSLTFAALPPPPPGSQSPHPEISREDLGMRNIEGVNARGTRMITVFPTGSIGNDQSITVTSESWFSPDLNLNVLSKTSDPRYGETTTRLTGISQAEPDPSLFQIPDDYSVVDTPPDVVQNH